MKKLLITIMLSLTVALSATAQTQQGIVKTPGRLGNDGKVIAGQRLSGATVQVKGRSAVVSGTNGMFSFPLSASKFFLQSVTKKDYVLVDPEAIKRQYTYSTNPLILVMETPGKQADSKLANERKIRRSLQRKLQAKEDELEALKEQNRINEEEYRQQLQQIYKEQEDNEKLISDIAERYSQIDYDQLDEFNLRISDCILNGRLTEADSLLRTKGDINARIANLEREMTALAAEEADLAQRQENLEKGKAGVQATKEDIAQDCYHRYELFLMNHQSDSAVHYLELCADLDTTNIKWQLKAGVFINDLLENYQLALKHLFAALRQAQTQYGKTDERLFTIYYDISCVYCDMGDYKKALEYNMIANNTCQQQSCETTDEWQQRRMFVFDFINKVQTDKEAILRDRYYAKRLLRLSVLLAADYITENNKDMAIKCLQFILDINLIQHGEQSEQVREFEQQIKTLMQ